jgi:hypothetical protein
LASRYGAILATSRSTDEHAAHRPTLGPQHAVANLIAAGLGLAGTTASLALPASGNAIEAAAAVNPLIEPVYWRRYYWHRWHRWHHRW